MSSQFPKVLVIGTPINQTSGSSITVSNLFHDWPEEKLATIHNSLNGNDSGRAKEFRLRMEMVLPWMRRGAEWKTREQLNDLLSGREIASLHSTLHRDMFRKMVEYLGISGLIRQFPVTPDLVDFIADFGPDVIYTQLGDIPMATLLLNVRAHFDVPYVVHIMDDYPSILYREGLLAKKVRGKMHNQLLQIFDQAGICMGISQTMCEEYSLRYCREFIPFHNAVDRSIWDNGTVCNYQNKKSFKMVYSGRIGVSCLTSIQEICNVIRRWNNTDISVTFDIYVSNISQALRVAPFLAIEDPKIIVKEAPQSAKEIASLLRAADILVLPIDFDRDSIEYIRFSMPTKVSAYLSTGVPVLVYGPPDIASVRYAKTQGWGFVIEERSSELLSQGISRLCLDKALRLVFSQRARRLAALNHDAALVRERFRQAMVDAATRTTPNKSEQTP